MKQIGIYGYSTGENSFGVGKQYLSLISKYGVPKILTPDNLHDKSIDMLLLPGGMDINPSSYGKIPGYFTSNTDVFKQHVFDNCLQNYVGRIPIVGICLGMQQLGVHLGANLTQDLPYHEQSYPESKPSHDVFVDNNVTISLLNKTYKPFKVTSTHHQGFLREDIVNAGNGIEIICYAQNEEYEKVKTITGEDIVECFIQRDLRILGIQSHPERYCPELFDSLIRMLINE